eukprot:TRINITY_DN7204_c1_g1_i1.p1 TRINITY_DN7204_c1_g1~~TRINITY_DN7204_c1_g1_i1.p1  ORF type:complete len:308 (-),score=42.98 TRINITY_DN7204_c1_g1_i1:74-973(-)
MPSAPSDWAPMSCTGGRTVPRFLPRPQRSSVVPSGLVVLAAAAAVTVAAADLQAGGASQTPWWQQSSVENAKSLALYFDREARRYFVYTEGNIAASEKALNMYFNVARGPTVKNICEIGFNAGHSAALFLNANPLANLYSFDIAQFKYTIGNLMLMKELFTDRFEFILGSSEASVPEFNKMRPDVKCDVISVDGDHSTEGTYNDLVNMRKLASCRNWVLMDDAGWKSTNTAWQKAKDDGIITQVECFVDVNPRPDYQFMDFPTNRSWCLGFFNIEDESCPAWFDENPNTDKTYVRPIEV